MDIYNVANQMKLERKTIFDLNIRVTFYARVSTTRDEQENSIENQIAYFTEMIKGNKNWEYVEGYVDRIRGESAENRTEFMQMINDGKGGKFDLIITKEVSRFARDTVDSLNYTRDLLRCGVGVFFQNDNICTVDTDSELRLTIMASIAADEVRKLSERIRWGHRRSIESGNVLGNNRIFGYDLYDKKLHINEREAEMVKLIFELYSSGHYSVRKIEQKLYDEGFRGRNGNRIHHNTISGIIQNPKYKGYFCGGKVKITDFRTRQQRFLPEEEWIMHKDLTGETVPAIVSEDLWDRCNQIFKERSEIVKSKERSIKDRSVFTGKIWCAVDGKAYWRTSYSNSKQKGKSIYQWICSEKKRINAKACPSFSILESELYQMVGEFFQSVVPSIESYTDNFISIYQKNDSATVIRKQLREIEDKIGREKAKKDKLFELYLDEIITKNEFKKRNDDSDSLIASLESNAKELKRESSSDKTVETIKEITAYIKDVYSPGEPMPKELVDDLVETIIDRIDVEPVNDNSMKVSIKLRTGEKQDYKYSNSGRRLRNNEIGNLCSSGIMSFTIWPPIEPACFAVSSPL